MPDGSLHGDFYCSSSWAGQDTNVIKISHLWAVTMSGIADSGGYGLNVTETVSVREFANCAFGTKPKLSDGSIITFGFGFDVTHPEGSR